MGSTRTVAPSRVRWRIGDPLPQEFPAVTPNIVLYGFECLAFRFPHLSRPPGRHPSPFEALAAMTVLFGFGACGSFR